MMQILHHLEREMRTMTEKTDALAAAVKTLTESVDRALAKLGRRIASRSEMIAMTTSSSISVNPKLLTAPFRFREGILNICITPLFSSRRGLARARVFHR